MTANLPPTSPPTEPVFEASGLKKNYDDGQVQALRGVDFRIGAGEFVAIVGPSGCGKTTLLQLLGALDKPTAGSLAYRGSSLPDRPDLAAYRAREIGFIFQSFHLLPTFTAAENVQLPMFETDRPRPDRRERATELLKAVGLERRYDHFPAKLSGANASASRSPAASRMGRASCWPTSRLGISTAKTPTPSSTCSAVSSASAR